MSLRFYFFIIIVLGLFSLYLGCNKSPTSGDEEKDDVVDVSHFSIENYPRVDGSTSAHPLQILIACKILSVAYQWDEWLDGTRRVRPSESDPAKSDVVEYIEGIDHSGTHGSFVNLITDCADVIIVAREPSDDEISLADSLDITIETEAIALDAFVFILNVNNPINGLTVDQIQGIYTGNITNWQEVGGVNAAINPYQRNKNSGSQELMETLVMKGLQMKDAPEMILLSMMGPINKLDTDPYGIGYTVYFFSEYMAPRDDIKLCWINGVKPDPVSISTASYIYTTQVYAAIRSDLDTQSTAFTLWKWLKTVSGQRVIGESGYIPAVVVINDS